MSRGPLLVAISIAVSTLTVAGCAEAHDQPFSFVDIHMDGSHLSGTVAAHVDDLAHDVGTKPESLLFEVPPDHLAAIRTLLGERLLVAAGGGEPVRFTWGSVQNEPERSLVRLAWSAELGRRPGELRVSAALFPYDPQHQTYLNIYETGRLRDQEILDGERSAITYYSGGSLGALAVLRRFVPAGVHHIFIGPDHVLFIVGLLLLGGTLGRLLRIVTAFTVAHSLTLGLATFNLLDPPARLIEPLIAASIVYVGVENLFAMKTPRDRRALIAFVFGFVHGFGFAGVLRELGLPSGALGWSLLGFNGGVEVGQATIVCLVAPALSLIHARRPAVATRIVGYGSVFVIVAGGFWLIERAFFS